MLVAYEGDYLWSFVGPATGEQGQTVYVLRRTLGPRDDQNGTWLRVVSTESLLTDYVRVPAPKKGRKS